MDPKTKIQFSLTERQWKQVSLILNAAAEKLEEIDHDIFLTLDRMAYKIDHTLSKDFAELEDWSKELRERDEEI